MIFKQFGIYLGHVFIHLQTTKCFYTYAFTRILTLPLQTYYAYIIHLEIANAKTTVFTFATYRYMHVRIHKFTDTCSPALHKTENKGHFIFTIQARTKATREGAY